jgi:CDP-glycerol glycerophosphotransferase
VTTERISVVVPFFNNGDVLGDCLASIAAQTFRDLQVIMVDDGSTDDGAEIARKWAASDARFSLIQVKNGGPGKARNRGVSHARGEFLAFVDGDDLLPTHAYEVLLHTLESSGSDFVSGAVKRIGTSGVHPSALHERAIKGRKTGTHVTRSPELLYDISVWNKLFRKAFWDAHHLHYPEGMVWEDLQLMTRAHVLAKAVDVIPDHIYLWRERAAGELSITQNRTDIQNLRDRVAALLAIDGFLAENAPARLLRQHQRKALVNDLWLYVRDLCRVSEDYLSEYLVLVGSYLATVSRAVHLTLPATHKLAYHLTRERLRGPLLEYVAWLLGRQVTTVGVVRRLGRLRADLPFRTDKTLKIPSHVYRPYWRDLDPFVQVESVRWDRGRLVIAGFAYVPSIDMSKRRYTSKIVVLRPRHRLRPPVISLATSHRSPRATVVSGQEAYDYTWAGFRCEISARWFRVAGRWLTGDWDCLILVRAHGVWRPARVHSPALGDAGRPGSLEPEPGVAVRPTWVGRHLHVGVIRTPARLAAFEHGTGGLALHVSLDAPAGHPPPGAEFVLVRHGGRVTRSFAAQVTATPGLPAVVTDPHTVQVSATIALDLLAAGQDPAGPAAGPWDADAAWDLYLQPAGRGRIAVTFPQQVHEARYRHLSREVAVERSRHGNVTLVRRVPRPVIDEHSWSAEGRLLLQGSYLGQADDGLEAVLRSSDASMEHVISCDRAGDRFAVLIDAPAMATFGRPLPLGDGQWDLFARAAPQSGGTESGGTESGGTESDGTESGGVASGGRVTRMAHDHARLAEVSHKKTCAGRKLYAFTTAGYDAPVITAEPQLRLSEQGNFNRRVLRKAFYPLQARRPLRDAVLFVSWKGRQCNDNPRGIAEELRRRGDDREHVWVVTDYCADVPAGGRAVLSGTEDYFEALARCRYVISNDDLPQEYRKRDGQIYLQTWHGTPLKRIGFDIDRPQFASGSAYFDRLADDVAKWDLLLSQNAFSTPILRRAFRFGGEICEFGYPRNDALSRGGERAAAIRERLGIPAGKRVVLYAPTWRDNQYYASGRYRFDLRLDIERAWQVLGDDHVLLIRGHHQLASDTRAGSRPGFALNVTGYPDVTDLFMITDVLVTDYSSVMFDFAVTGKPMLFFTYDLAQYRDQLRGFYFDLEAQAPGPLLATSDEVIAAVRDIGQVMARYRAAYRAFAATYCPLDDGKAAARVCDRLLAG